MPSDKKAPPARRLALSGASRSPPKTKRGRTGFVPLPKEKVREVFERLSAANPQPRSELEFKNPYTLLVAVVLSAQATDLGVNRATKHLFAIADTPQKMLALGEARLVEMVKTIGLFRNKARNIMSLSQRIIGEFGGSVPREREALESLPGVGRKTANVVLNVAFGEPTIAVDTHVFRVANRLPLAIAKTPIEVERALEKAIPVEFKDHSHHWLILHGRYVCKARRPQCARCVLEDLCRFPGKTV